MWTVRKRSDALDIDREPIPAAVRNALIRWYVGQGEPIDQSTGIALVRTTKTRQRWIVCDCLGEDREPPVLAPSYLAEAETYYLRRLTGDGRPEHAVDCPFYRNQFLYPNDARRREYAPLAPPSGFFFSVKPLGEHLARQPIDDADTNRIRHGSSSLLARLMWRLLNEADTITIPAVHETSKPSIAGEYRKIDNASRNLWVAPDIRLDKLLFKHAAAFHSGQVYAVLRRALPSWPKGSAPQAFLLLFASEIHERAIIVSGAEPVLVAADIKLPHRRNDHSGPYLTLVTIAEHPTGRGFAPIRGYAQPIQNGQHFVPVSSAAERAVLAILLGLRWPLHDEGLSLRIRKPVFDLETSLGYCRPDFMVEVFRAGIPGSSMLALELVGYADWSERELKVSTMPAMTKLALVTIIDISELEQPERLKARLLDLFRRSWPSLRDRPQPPIRR